ncbi:MAG: beta-carotene ketolase [Phormidesmis sp. RL_2_1]|nr:beta-carotene ketolase [Phormidesmis sp. RL_2_1]
MTACPPSDSRYSPPSVAFLRESALSIAIALVIVLLWMLSAYASLFVLPDASTLPLAGVIGMMMVRAFLHTGLFILSHDAMHGSLVPAYPKANKWIGQFILGLYSFLSFKRMQNKHHQHHRTPAQPGDPDFHPGSFWAWYFGFMRTYVKGDQGWIIFWGMSALFYPLVFIFHLPVTNVVLFWLLPQGLSSWQLFYFGTYRPHRCPTNGHTNPHRANSSKASLFWSFLSCYHFDYHWEHHQYPHLPWYKLPSARRQSGERR